MVGAFLRKVELTWNHEGAMDQSQHHSQSNSQTLDLSGALNRLRGDRKLLMELIGFFLEDYDRALADVHRAAEKGSSRELQLAAHNLKGLAANFDAQEVIDATTAIELHAKEDDVPCAINILPNLDDSMTRLVDELKQYHDQNRH
jgi:two-component system, sensor histidine kinase and response regulator